MTSTANTVLCQQCKDIVQLDPSLVDLAPSAFDTVLAALPPTPRSRHVDPTTRARAKQPHFTTLPNESFVLLQDSIIRSVPPSPTSTRSNKSASSRPRNNPQPVTDAEPSPSSRSAVRLLHLISTRSDIDHPLCRECTHTLLASLQTTAEELKRERDGYLAFANKELRKEKEREAEGLSKEESEKKIEKLMLEEKSLIEQLKDYETDERQLAEELSHLEQEETLLASEEENFWRNHNDNILALDQQASHLASLRAAYAADSAALEKLERSNVYNDAFCIGHDGVFGTINGLRLGRVPGVPVEWAEINAAWGQTLLLLHTIARKLDYKFENYRLVPMGSFSRIERITGDKASYELYGSGHVGRLLHNRRFDLGMVAFIDCLKSLIDYIKSQDPTVDFPHAISREKIGDVSIKLQFNQEEAWTRSLRHVLLALKICLKWATNGVNG
ncbi:hypothetical protein D9758_001828 [Tetrapyrgos nigripes]|uniref:Autophagy-related protein 6 n=1 Tax=Tetrapyrgos nigripes TaxID=182062 RepID=A0A8H5GSZ7_9AGAR|nr:hypothetical protein D9758_001828 [Tetrapyrgos nigripes]